jgi:hypothetical protein
MEGTEIAPQEGFFFSLPTILSTQCFFFWGKISPNLDLKNMILSYVKDFPCKKWPKLARFRKK